MTNILITVCIGLIVLNFLHNLFVLHRVKKIEKSLPELRGDLNYTCTDAIRSAVTSDYIIARRPTRKSTRKEAANE